MSTRNILDNLVTLWHSVVNPSRSWLLRESSEIGFMEARCQSAHNVGGSVGIGEDKVEPSLTLGRVNFIRQFGESKRLIYAHALGSLVPGRNILCNPTNNPLTTHFLARKLGCCSISYRNIKDFFYRQFIGNLSAKLKLFFNRGNPTPLINSYLTNLYRLFVAFLYPEGDKKSLAKKGAK